MKKDMDFHKMSEQDIIDFFLDTNNDKLACVPVVLKGFSSTLSKSTELFNDIPILNIPNKIFKASEIFFDTFIKAYAYVVNEEPDEIIKNNKILDLLRLYYKNRREGDKVSKEDKQKKNALSYYNNMWDTSKKLSRNFKKAFEKREWICNLFIADAQSYIGSINTSVREFDEGNNNFENSLLEMDKIEQDYDIISLDRRIEIAGFHLSNELRDKSKILEFIEKGKISNYDDKFKHYVDIAEKGYNKFTYVRSTQDEILNYLDEHYNKIGNNDYRTISTNINVFLRNNNARKINRSIGKYYAIRGCYDFIFVIFFKENREEHINEAESKIRKGLLLLTKSSLGDDQISSIDEYFDSNAYDSGLQIDFARNFTILYGLGCFTNDSVMMNKYLRDLSKLYYKEEKVNNKENKEKVYNSINESIVNVLKPFGIKIDDTDNFIDKIKCVEY
jgi:hypothetical protein